MPSTFIRRFSVAVGEAVDLARVCSRRTRTRSASVTYGGTNTWAAAAPARARRARRSRGRRGSSRDGVAQEAHAEGHVAVLVALHQAEALAEARVQSVLEHVVADQRLAGHGQEALDDHVVGRDALHEQLEVVRASPGCGAATSRRPSSNTSRHGDSSICSTSRMPAAEVVGVERHHLGAEAVEEGGVARLVHELGGEEQLDLAGGRRLQERREVGRHALLADVERAEAPDRVLLRLARASPATARGRPRSRARARASSGAPRARTAGGSRAGRRRRGRPRARTGRRARSWRRRCFASRFSSASSRPRARRSSGRAA